MTFLVQDMEPEFWLERWQANLIGFHQDEINDYLLRYWPKLGVMHNSRILVPLCGKSLDMLWLAEQGHPVIGIEISQLAVESFFNENGLTAEIHKQGYGLRYTSAQLEILCADYFALTQQDIGEVAAFYDRAALIALPPAQRPGYVAQLGKLTGAGTHGLLITLAYNQLEMSGPPFSVTDAEVQRLFTPGYRLDQLFQFDVLAANERFRKQGLTALTEQAYQLTRL